MNVYYHFEHTNIIQINNQNIGMLKVEQRDEFMAKAVKVRVVMEER